MPNVCVIVAYLPKFGKGGELLELAKSRSNFAQGRAYVGSGPDRYTRA
jgi:hypothetical protein